MVLHSRARRHGLVLLSYGLLSLILTYPLILHFTTHVPGDGIDDPALTWNLWWVRFSILKLHGNPFHCRWMFWPIGINLAFYTLTVLNGLLSIPLQTTLGIVPASNILLLSSFILGGYGAYLLAWEVWGTGHRPTYSLLGAAWLSGLIYAFASNKLFYAALGQFNIASSQWVPFCMLYVWRAGRENGRPRDAILAGLFLGLQAWAEATFASFLLIFIGIYALWRAAAHPRRGTWLPWVTRLAILGLVFAAIIVPMLANMWPDLRAEGDFLTSGGGFADVFSADLAGYLIPTLHHPLLGHITAHMPFPHDKGQHVYLGYSTGVLALIGLLHRPQRTAAFWGIAAVVFFLLTLGPTLRVMGHDTGIPGPFALVSRWPFFKGNRYPSRYAVPLLLSISMLAAGGVLELPRRLPRLHIGMLVPIAALLFLAEHIAIPLPLSDMGVPGIYHRIAAETDPTPGAVMELPLGWRNGARVVGKQDVIIMFEQWYQTVHHRPILGGNTSRNPEFKFQYFSEAPVLDLLIGMINADRPLHQALRDEIKPIETWVQNPSLAPKGWLTAQRKQAAQVLDALDIAYVVIHRDKVPPALEQYVRAVFPIQLVEDTGNIALYRVQRTLRALPPSISLGSNIGHLLLGEGWSPPAPTTDGPLAAAVWAERREVRLQIPVTARARGLELLMRAPGPGQEVSLTISGYSADRQPISTTWRWVRFTWPPGQAKPGLAPVRLRFARTYDLNDVLTGTSPAPGLPTHAALLIRSAGEEVGDFAHIYVNGIDYSPNHRGYNLVLFDPDNGTVRATASFDTHASARASDDMASWLRSAPPGLWVLGTVRDEASLHLSESAIAALHSLGITTDLRGRFRWSHAFIGAQGWTPEQARDRASALRPATIVVNLPATRSHVAAEVAAIRTIPVGDE
ncbi:MAG: hypothetical protein J7M34_11330 [Anaerolineae bacterium]|nr:hypothetical protein [Anaerolineae bacterium]